MCFLAVIVVESIQEHLQHWWLSSTVQSGRRTAGSGTTAQGNTVIKRGCGATDQWATNGTTSFFVSRGDGFLALRRGVRTAVGGLFIISVSGGTAATAAIATRAVIATVVISGTYAAAAVAAVMFRGV